VKAAVFAGLEDPLFGIMMRSDRVDKRASLGISHGARSHMCLKQTETWRSTHDLKTFGDSAARSERPSGVWRVVMDLTLGCEPLEMERVETSGDWREPKPRS
jgi:hypothetical protein